MSPVIRTSATSWANKHDTYRNPIQALLLAQNDPPESGDPLTRYNRSTRMLQALIGDALREQVRLRAYGGGWSFSGAPSTDGWMLDTSALNLWFNIGAASLAPAYQGSRDSLTFVQCGNSIAGLNRNFRLKGRSLRTTGASNGQSIVGAMSTGTHGAAIDVGGVQDYVVGIHLIVSPGRHVWIERTSYPVVSDSFIQAIGAERLRSADDDDFDAVLVGFGAFGIIHGVMIETDPIFLYEMHRQRRKLDAALETAISTQTFDNVALPDPGQRPYFFEVLLNPFDLPGGVYVTTMYKRPFTPDYRPPVRTDVVPGDDAIALVGTLTDSVPEVIPKAVGLLVGGRYKDSQGAVLGTTNEIFPVTTTRGKAAGSAIGVPADHALEVAKIIMDINREHGPFPCILSLRFVKGTRALLGFTRFPQTCVIDVDGPLSNRTRSFYSRIWQELASKGLTYTMHWGKILGLSAREVRRLYGSGVDRWLNVRQRLVAQSDPRLIWTYSNRFLEELGLDR